MPKAHIENGQVVVTESFGVGNLVTDPDRGDSDVMSMDVKAMLLVLKASLENQAREGKDITDMLEHYCKLWLLEMLGVNSHPIIKHPDGRIEGLSYEVVREGF